MVEIQLIEADKTIPLRQRLLRPHLTLKQNELAEDRAQETFHIGAFDGEKLVCIATFIHECQEDFDGKNCYRLRQMATEPEHRGQGVARRVLQAGLDELKVRGADVLWCHARMVAFKFYEKMGLEYHGEFFDVPHIGPHKIMFMRLR